MLFYCIKALAAYKSMDKLTCPYIRKHRFEWIWLLHCRITEYIIHLAYTVNILQRRLLTENWKSASTQGARIYLIIKLFLHNPILSFSWLQSWANTFFTALDNSYLCDLVPQQKVFSSIAAKQENILRAFWELLANVQQCGRHYIFTMNWCLSTLRISYISETLI